MGSKKEKSKKKVKSSPFQLSLNILDKRLSILQPKYQNFEII